MLAAERATRDTTAKTGSAQISPDTRTTRVKEAARMSRDADPTQAIGTPANLTPTVAVPPNYVDRGRVRMVA